MHKGSAGISKLSMNATRPRYIEYKRLSFFSHRCLFYLQTPTLFNRCGEGIFHVRFSFFLSFPFHAWMPQSLLRSKSTFASFSYEKCTRRNLLLINRVTTDTRVYSLFRLLFVFFYTRRFSDII